MSEQPGMTGSVSRTSYEIRWYRPDTKPIPDFDEKPHARLYVGTDGLPLFTVVTHGGSAEGIFALIAEAPRMRDEIDGRQQRENSYATALERIVRHIAGMSAEYDLKIPRQMVLDAREVLGDADFDPVSQPPLSPDSGTR